MLFRIEVRLYILRESGTLMDNGHELSRTVVVSRTDVDTTYIWTSVETLNCIRYSVA